MANKKWPLFLCLLLLGQEFALTRARLEDLPSTYERLSSSKTVEGLEETGLQLRHPELDDIILDSDDVQMKNGNGNHDGNDDNEEDDDDIDDEEAVRRADQQLAVRKAEVLEESIRREKAIARGEDKRIFGAILFGISLITMFANIGLDIYLKYKGCCGIYSSICRDQKTFKRMRADLEKKSKIVDGKYAAAKDLREKVIKGNDNNRQIWLKIKEISFLQKDILTILSPDIIIKFNNVGHEIKQGVKKKNQTVLSMSYKEVDSKYQSVFDNAESAALTLAGVAGLGLGKIASLAFQRYKTAQIAKTLKTSYGAKLKYAAPKVQKLFGVTNGRVSAHIAQTAKSNYRAMASVSRTARFVRVAGGVMSLVSIGVDIYSIYSKIKNCQIKRDRAKESVRDVVKADQETNEMLGQVNEYLCTLEFQGWFRVISQIRSSDLTAALVDIKKLANGAASTSPNLRQASADIATFMRDVHNADKPRTIQLQAILESGLSKVEFTLECYLKKLLTAEYCVSHCEKGQHQLITLYNRAITLFNPNRGACRSKSGLAYTTFKSVQDVVKKAAKGKFNVECVLNSRYFKERVCREKHNGLTADQIVAAVKPLTKSQVVFLSKDCPELPLTPKEKAQVCLLKNGHSFTDEQVANSLGLKLNKVKAVNCPKPEPVLTAKQKVQVCHLRKYKVPDDKVAELLEVDLALVKKHKCE